MPTKQSRFWLILPPALKKLLKSCIQRFVYNFMQVAKRAVIANKLETKVTVEEQTDQM